MFSVRTTEDQSDAVVPEVAGVQQEREEWGSDAAVSPSPYGEVGARGSVGVEQSNEGPKWFSRNYRVVPHFTCQLERKNPRSLQYMGTSLIRKGLTPWDHHRAPDHRPTAGPQRFAVF